MILTAHVVGHASYLSGDQIQRLGTRFQAYFNPSDQFHTPGIANRQMKTVFIRILDKVVKNVLEKLQGILRSSDHKTKWIGAFMCMLGMAMACEEIQSTTETIGTGNETVFGCNQQSARSANDCIDQYFAMMCSLFHMKYKSFTPMMKPDSEDVLRQIGPHAIPIIKKIKALCEEKCMFSQFEFSMKNTLANFDYRSTIP
jgi:hypothetical protein